jgi:hypothetical protein
MPIDFNKNFLFIHIPKCAGTTVEKMLNLDSVGCWVCQKKVIPKLHKLKSAQHLTYQEYKALISSNYWTRLYKFAFVRNPYDRIVSEYFYCRQEKPFFKYPDFESFVKALPDLPEDIRIKREKFDGHVETMTSFLEGQSGDVEVYRFENFVQEFQKLTEKLGIKITADVPVLRKSKFRPEKPFMDFYNPETKTIVSELYDDDFKNFGYHK